LSENAAKIARAKCAAWGIEIGRRTTGRFEGQAVDDGLTAEEEIIRVMKSVIDHLHHDILSIHFLRIKDLHTKFGSYWI